LEQLNDPRLFHKIILPILHNTIKEGEIIYFFIERLGVVCSEVTQVIPKVEVRILHTQQPSEDIENRLFFIKEVQLYRKSSQIFREIYDPSLTPKKLYDPKLFTELGPDSEYKIGEILYMYTEIIPSKFKSLSYLQVVGYDPKNIKFINLRTNDEQEYLREAIGYVDKTFPNYHLFRENIFTKLLEGTEPNDESHIETYLRSPDNMREISQYLGGKKYRKKTKRTKRTTKTNRKKRTRRR